MTQELTTTVLEAFTGAVGEILTDAGGLRQTRIAAAGHAGDTQIVLERSVGWPVRGSIAVDGATYAYAFNAGQGVLTGLTTVVGGQPQTGLVADLSIGAAVTDVSRSYSGVDQLRQAIMVGTAQGDDLSALGRNLGVLRLPYVRTDDQYRQVIQALAYNPRGTVYGLTLALNGLLGAGNYTLREDLVASPNTVFISFPGAVYLDKIAQGKAYLTGPVDVRASGTNVSLPLPDASTYARVSQLRLSPLAHLTDCRTALPSADTVADIAGDMPQATWTFCVGTSPSTAEGTYVAESAATGGAAQFIGSQGYYLRKLPLRANSTARLDQVLTLPSGAAPSATDGRQHLGAIADGTQLLSWGVIAAAAGTYQIGILNASGAFLVGAAATLPYGQVHEIVLEKRGQTGSLYLDGRLLQRVAYATLPATPLKSLAWGNQQAGGGGLPKTLVRQVEYYVSCPTDFWASSGTGSVSSGSDLFTDASGIGFVAGDVGSQVLLSGGTAKNAQGGTNNGTFVVSSVDSASGLHLTGQTYANAQVLGSAPTQVTVPTGNQPLVYPDDLGKAIVITGSLLGNNGTYVISRLYDPVTGTDLSTYQTPLTVRCTQAQVLGASFVTEGQLGWRLDPRFVSETTLTCNVSDTGTMGAFNAGGRALSTRPALPEAGAAYRVTANTVLSSQAIGTHDPINHEISEGPPPTFTCWPFYILDPFDFSTIYLRQIVAAGVRIVFSFS